MRIVVDEGRVVVDERVVLRMSNEWINACKGLGIATKAKLCRLRALDMPSLARHAKLKCSLPPLKTCDFANCGSIPTSPSYQYSAAYLSFQA
jgi:hypothetical protein